MYNSSKLGIMAVAVLVPLFQFICEQAFADDALKNPITASINPIASDYCRNFVDQASAARTARLKQEIESAKAEVDKKLAELETQTALLQQWVEKRDKIRNEITAELIKIYSGIEPDAAARQLEKLDIASASEILRRLNAKRAGEILSIMEAGHAASIEAALAQNIDKGQSHKL